jgi:hypothetical protein
VDPDLWLPLGVTLLLFVAGVVLTVVPVFPGPVLVFAGVASFQLWRPEAGPGTVFLGVALAATLATLVLDVFLSILGARRYGATWRGALGALFGAVVGLFLPPPLLWIFIGPVVGAILGELLGGRRLAEAGRAGWGTLLGALLATAVKLAVCVFLVAGFAFLVIRKLTVG